LRKRFLTVYGYGTGGEWQYITADSAEQIESTCRALVVTTESPDWLTPDALARLPSYDIDHLPAQFLGDMRGQARAPRLRCTQCDLPAIPGDDRCYQHIK
jgi:hypothetical protein